MNDLFAPNAADAPKGPLPLAERLRPRAIDQVIGFLGTTRRWQNDIGAPACGPYGSTFRSDQCNFHGCPRFEKGV